MKSFFSKIINIGVKPENSGLDNKKTKILNFCSLLSLSTVTIFSVLDYVLGMLNLGIVLFFIIHIIFLLCVFLANKLEKYFFARFLFVSLITFALFSQNNFLFKGFYGEYMYLAIPMVCIFFFEKKIIYFFSLVLSIVLFYFPNYLLNIYPEQYFGYSNTIFLFVGIFSIVYFFKNENRKSEIKLNQNNLKLIQLNEELEISKKNEVAISNLKALKSQMNPHFIFNLLNSIQALVLKGEIDASYNYMTKFATLVRQTLHFSDAVLVELEEEIDLLKVYLDLEKLRFNKDFEFEIVYDDIEGIEIPPLLIQPFIENALVHGLLHKNGQKNLKLEFEISDKLICTITDNGIGRAESQAINERQMNKHQSFSSKAIEKRFKILSETYKGEFGFHYKDITEENEFIATQVKLYIPYNRVF